MRIGVPKEVKSHEYRVGLVPASVRELVQRGHRVMIETQAGAGIGIEDSDYEAVGAEIVADAQAIFSQSELVIKVKEPQSFESKQLREGQILFTYLHLAPEPGMANLLKLSGATAIAYETVTHDDGSLPLLTPMSQVAGRMSIQAGAHALEKAQCGRGVLLGGVPGVPAARVVVLGGGVVGSNAARMAVGMEADVTVLDKSLPQLNRLDQQFGSKIKTVYATAESIEENILQADLVIGAVLIPGAAAPKVVTKDFIQRMRPGAVMVDVSIDQGGCFDTSRPTTHEKPTYVEAGIVHYCVSNMPGAVPRTSTFALNNATLPYIISLADKGLHRALLDDPHLMNGLNVHAGQLTYKAVAMSLDEDYIPAKEALLA